MILEATNPEIAAIVEAQRAALARLGLMASIIATAEWANVSALKPAATAAVWSAQVIRAVYALRVRARRVAISGYQLARALDTGYTLGEPLDHPPAAKQATLGQLRRTFERELIDVATIDDEPGGIDDPDIRWVEEQLAGIKKDKAHKDLHQVFQDTSLDPHIQNLLDKQGSDDSARITIEPHDWGRDKALEQVAATFRKAIEQASVKSQEDFVEKARAQEDMSPDQVLTEIEKHHDIAGGIGAGEADQAVMEAARSAVDSAMRTDRRVKLVARGTSAAPCAFCAMLASRGFVYASRESAVGIQGDEIKQYHRHCHCYPIVRWVDAVELPPLSQFFKDQWSEVTQGYSGVDALNAWRRWLTRQRREGFQFPSNLT